MFSFDEVKNYDPEIAAAMNDELKRQQDHIELIASENIVSKAVMSAMGSILTNKYAEGYPGKRYYGGCEYVDVVEQLAIDRAKELFGCTYANVQPHSGAQANLAVFFALVKPGDTVMGMSLDAGGHLTHGSKVNISGTYFNIVSYGVNEETLLNLIKEKYFPRLDDRYIKEAYLLDLTSEILINSRITLNKYKSFKNALWFDVGAVIFIMLAYLFS